MDLAGYPGKGTFAVLLGVTLWVYGSSRADRTAKQLAYAILISLTAVAALTSLLKYGLQLPRPTPRSGFGFPSGDSATAFAVAAAAGTAYPVAAPALYFVAAVVAIGRLYFRAHFVWDVIGGAVLGSICGYWAARRLLPKQSDRPRSYGWLCAWLPGALLSLGALSFFWLLERETAQHKVSLDSPAPAAPIARIEFGTASARAHLLSGWTEERVWPSQSIPFNWAEGLHASLGLHLVTAENMRLLIRAYPYRPQGFLCQRAAVHINGALLDELFFEQDWQDYALPVPQHFLRGGDNRIDFTFKYSDRADWHGMNRAGKELSVAFHTLSLFPANKSNF